MTKNIILFLIIAGVAFGASHKVQADNTSLEPETSVKPAAEETAKIIDSPPVEDKNLQKAWGDIQEGNWKQAREKVLVVIAKNKKNPEAWTLLGRTYFMQPKYKKAIRRFKKALKYDPHYAQAYFWKGKAYEALNKVDEAENEYQAAFRADPNLEEARNSWKKLREQASTKKQ